MSNYFRPSTSHKARKGRPCIWCAEPIEAGSTYTKQSGFFEGDAFTCHYHPECFDCLTFDDRDGFTPYSNERPEPAPATPGGAKP